MTFPRLDANSLARPRTTAFPDSVLHTVREIVDTVRTGGESALRDYTLRFAERGPTDPLYLDRDQLQNHLDALPPADRRRLQRIAGRIESFARAQRDSLTPMTVAIPGGAAGQFIEPLRRVGCYTPGGRYPLPSSTLMTVLPARVAGVETVWVASPRPAPITAAAAAVAGADGMLVAGGAHAIAALAFGVGPVPPSDIVVGPGNVYVTAAKQLIAHHVAIDMVAGPSELVIIADDTADPRLAAADLLAQAEHDPEALPVLLATSESLAEQVEAEIERQLRDLPTAEVARAALRRGGVVVCRTLDEAVRTSNEIAPEHLQLSVAQPDALLEGLVHYGAVFVGEQAGEVLGDYGAGPNHVLPSGGAARHTGGLSVFTFLRIRTWMGNSSGEPAEEFLEDVAWMARQEGLEAHARAAEARR